MDPDGTELDRISGWDGDKGKFSETLKDYLQGIGTLKALLAEQKIHVVDLKFNSESQCHGFIKRLLLLAAEDECRHRSPSKIATLARELISHKA